MGISQLEIEILQALVREETPFVRSSHRLRLEMLGLVKDGPFGLCITAAGREAAGTTSALKAEPIDMPPVQLDGAGRRRMLRRGHALE
jgi:hypothetical protein